jgi:hypothetical protein
VINLRILVAAGCFRMLLIQRYACVLDMYAASKNGLEKTIAKDKESYDK